MFFINSQLFVSDLSAVLLFKWHTWHAKPNTPFASSGEVERVQHTRAFTRACRPSRISPGLGGRQAFGPTAATKAGGHIHTSGPQSSFQCGAQRDDKRRGAHSRQWKESGDSGRSFCYFNVAVCVFWRGTLCLSRPFFLCVCVCVSAAV